MSFWGIPPKPCAPLAAVFPSLPGLILLLATLWELFLHSTLAKKSLPPLFQVWNISGQSLIGTAASLGWEAWGRAAVAGGCEGSITWGMAEGFVILHVIPGF